ncbi:substrate-binding domain-containing protein [Kosakonia sp. MUSA4]|uniref:substrate-binding domain-containing protein n=1 Tax=Kosakonia sp. MUSA4 TaxID=2067958 RepID=UPI0015993DBC|nr:substrate-binding domain-containing protein [Kosakonia sp. MUSA4]QJT83089.1 molybdate ABC transporter substrate-binding protein [Kosakonia sp. MUSA4]
MTLTVLAAGSLKRAFTPLLAAFSEQTGIAVEAGFGPAGLLRERIEAGERCALFASANTAHPQALVDARRARAIQVFAANALSLTVRSAAPQVDWLTLLADPTLRLGTSTPGCDPSGDYTWQLFAHLDTLKPGLGEQLRQRAQPLVGGRDSLTVPAKEIASAWLIREGFADMFIGYQHYTTLLAAERDVRVVDIPPAHNIRCNYALALLEEPAAPLMQFIVGSQGQACLRAAGFLPPQAE